MVFTKPSNYDNQQVLPEQSFMRLPKGGYVCKILSVEEQTSKAGNPYLLINMDIAEGEYVGFFADDYGKQTGEKKWHFVHRLMVPTDKTKPFTAQLFKTFNAYLADSNPGWEFNWDADEKQYRGKLIGVLVNERQFKKRDGTIGTATNIAKVVKASTIRSGSYTVPGDILVAEEKGSDFIPVDNVDDDDMPFN